MPGFESSEEDKADRGITRKNKSVPFSPSPFPPQYINRTYDRSGTLWEGRFRSCLLQEVDYVLACYCYIEMNPVRAGMVEHPAEYRWSSYGANAHGVPSAIIEANPLYTQLGETADLRASAYRELFRYQPFNWRISFPRFG